MRNNHCTAYQTISARVLKMSRALSQRVVQLEVNSQGSRMLKISWVLLQRGNDLKWTEARLRVLKMPQGVGHVRPVWLFFQDSH